MLSRVLGGHQMLLIGDLRRWGSLRNKGQVEVIDDPVDHGIVGEESDGLHVTAASGAQHGVNFVHLTDHLGPALGGDGPQLLLEHPERERPKASLPDLSGIWDVTRAMNSR